MIPIISRISNIYARVSRIYPDKPWLKVVARIKELQRRYPSRAEQAEVDSWLAFALMRCELHEYEVSPGYEWKNFAQAMLHVERIVDLLEAIRDGGEGPTGLEARFRGAFKNSADSRALRFEVYMAQLLATLGCKVIWPPEHKGEETFDLLVQPPAGLPEFELECKSLAVDKGLLASMSDGQRLMGACLHIANAHQYFDAQPGMASILSVNLYGKIPGEEVKLESLAEQILDALKDGHWNANPGVFTVQHDLRPLTIDPHDPDGCFLASETLEGGTLALTVTGSAEQGWKGFRICWAGKTSVWQKTERLAKDAADRQLTQKRPGAIALQFMNDAAEAITEANSDSNRFRLLAEKIFSRDHVAMVVVTNDSALRPFTTQPPFRPDAFLREFSRFAAFDNQTGTYPNSKLKFLFAQPIERR
ncbi:hypothetical protein AAIM60_13375 [Pseudomonas lijiangensis]|uniref:hypothetical protein n=1 Tax=Pseudomonas lijiangensis TaxID=2995658 RepID=UPI0031BA8150